MVLVSLPLYRLSSIPPHDYWVLVVALRPFLGARHDELMNLQAFASDRDVLHDHVNELLGIWRQVVFMVKRDPDFMYERYRPDCSVIDLAVGVSKASFPLGKIHPSLFLFARRMRHIPRHVQGGEEVPFDRIVGCMRSVRDHAIGRISEDHTPEELCLFLCYEAEIDLVEVDVSSVVAMNSAWRRFKEWLAADNRDDWRADKWSSILTKVMSIKSAGSVTWVHVPCTVGRSTVSVMSLPSNDSDDESE